MSASDNPGWPGAKSPGNRKARLLLVLATGLFVFAAAAAALYVLLQPTSLRIAVGPAGSEDQRLIQALAQGLARDGSPVRLLPVTTAGAVDSAVLLGSARTDLAVIRADNSELPADVASVAIMRRNVVVLWSFARATAKGTKKESRAQIKAIDDLAGRRVGVVGRTDENPKLLRTILKESGVDPAKVSLTSFGPNQIDEMARDPKIDAFMMVGPIDSRLIAEAIASTARRGEPRFLPVEVSEAIAQRHAYYESQEITGGSFSSSPARPDDKVETVGVNHLIVAPKSLSESTVGAFTRELFAIRQSIAREMPAAMKIAKPDTDKDAALPAHPGAAAYIDGTERTFMEKYSDLIWISIFLLTALGSAGAWLRYYLRRDERDQNTLHRDRLLATIAKVRDANSVEELADMQCEVDGILRETLLCYDDGAIEAGNLSAFGLVLTQFQHAVDDRRSALGDGTELLRPRAASPARPVTPS